MKGLILAAGRGSRMGALTEAIPKCLVPLGGRPLLEWQIAAMSGANVEDIGIVRGYKGHLLDKFGLDVFDNPRWAETNMVASLKCATSWLREGPVIVSYADIFYPTSAIQALIDRSAEIAVAFDTNWSQLWSQRFEDPLSDAESFALKGDKISDIGSKVERIEDIDGQYMGLLCFQPAGWRQIEVFLAKLPQDQIDSLDMTGLLSGLIKEGHTLVGVPVSDIWGEVDSQGDLSVYENWIKTGHLLFPSSRM